MKRGRICAELSLRLCWTARLAPLASAQNLEEVAEVLGMTRTGAYSLDLQIGGCTALIRSGTEPTESLAPASSTIAACAYNEQKNSAAAIAVYTQAIKLQAGLWAGLVQPRQCLSS